MWSVECRMGLSSAGAVASKVGARAPSDVRNPVSPFSPLSLFATGTQNWTLVARGGQCVALPSSRDGELSADLDF